MRRNEVREILRNASRELWMLNGAEIRDKRTGETKAEISEETLMGMTVALTVCDALLDNKADEERVSGPFALTNILVEALGHQLMGDEEEDDE